MKHDLLRPLFHIKCFQQGQCALTEYDHRAHVDPRCLSVICELCMYWPQFKERGGRSVFTLQTNLRSQITPSVTYLLSDQSGADMPPIQMSPKSTVSDSSELCEDEYHTQEELAFTRIAATCLVSIHEIPPVQKANVTEYIQSST